MEHDLRLGWLIGWLVGWMAGWLAGWLVGWVFSCSFGRKYILAILTDSFTLTSFFAFHQLAKRARGVVHVMLNGTRQHFMDRQIFPSFMDDRSAAFIVKCKIAKYPKRNFEQMCFLCAEKKPHSHFHALSLDELKVNSTNKVSCSNSKSSNSAQLVRFVPNIYQLTKNWLLLLFIFHSYLAENQLSSLPVHEVKEFRILVGHSLHHKSL